LFLSIEKDSHLIARREQFHFLAALGKLDDATARKLNLVCGYSRRMTAKLDSRGLPVRLKPRWAKPTRYPTHHFSVIDRTQDHRLGHEYECERDPKGDHSANSACNNPTFLVHKITWSGIVA